MDSALLARLNDANAQRKAVAVVTRLRDAQQELLEASEVANHPLENEITSRLRSGKSQTVSHDDDEYFIAAHVPSPRLVVIGAVHISQSLFTMAQACGFDVTIIDPRTAFATQERFSGVTLHAEWPEEILPSIPFDRFTALVAITHDPKIDDFPLMSALKANCFYVGALGSRKTHAKREERLLAQGVAKTELARIHAPIGLNIGAANPAEISVAIMAQIIADLRQVQQS